MFKCIVCILMAFSLHCSTLLATTNVSSEAYTVPVLYKGRIRPFSTYAHLWLNEIAGFEQIPKKLFPSFQSTTAEEFLWNLYLFGSKPYQNTPLFQITSKSIKERLGLDAKEDLFSYNQIKHENTLEEDDLELLKEHIKNFLSFDKDAAQEEYFSLSEALLHESNNFLMLPLKRPQGIWGSLDLSSKLSSNFTLYSNNSFNTLQSAYNEALRTHLFSLPLAEALLSAYQEIAGTIRIEAEGKALYYPTLFQLRLEHYTSIFPFTEVTLLFYSLACLFVLIFLRNKHIFWKNSGFYSLLLGLIVNASYLLLRCIILERPPVSNMFESVIYVPFIAVFAGLFLYYFFKNSYLLLASSLSGLLLLAILLFTGIDKGLENVQAVLDSGYWLTIHVLMVVGSYGLFILAGILGHFYLLLASIKRGESKNLQVLAKIILQCMYIGVALLVSGTILGGIWAAESWGRFWDWDPKESWAFISCCIYLLWIHAYRFNFIRHFGLAVGSILGLLAISFTWYGVNYVLGTGLHSYGFGHGGEVYYYLFVIGEGLFLTAIYLRTKYAITT